MLWGRSCWQQLGVKAMLSPEVQANGRRSWQTQHNLPCKRLVENGESCCSSPCLLKHFQQVHGYDREMYEGWKQRQISQEENRVWYIQADLELGPARDVKDYQKGFSKFINIMENKTWHHCWMDQGSWWHMMWTGWGTPCLFCLSLYKENYPSEIPGT